LISPSVFGAVVWTGKDLVPLPEGFFYGLPSSPGAAWQAKILTGRGRLRAMGELLATRRLRGPDISVAAFVRRRFGREVLERVVDPLLAGTRAGQVESMSLAAALPHVDSLARRYRSLMTALRKEENLGRDHLDAPPFKSLRSGMETLVAGLARAIKGRTEIITGRAVENLSASPGGLSVEVSAGRALRADGAVLAVPAFAAARMLRRAEEEAARLLSGIAHASVASVVLSYDRGSLPLPPETSGFLVASRAESTIAAGSWWSQKWARTVTSDGEIVRCFVGRADRHPALDLTDEDLVTRATTDLATILEVDASPRRSSVTRWDRALPQYEVGHLERVARIEKQIRTLGPVEVAGAGYRGSGIPDCVAQGRRAASNLRTRLES
ncbi:MAG: protoporphyrinogen oxidase, partial [Actinomycetota bacterium]|nr:protoporphyrinogen oxidase [Actinomycetota bacterium]